MKCIWQMDGDKVKGFKCDFTPIDMLIVISGLKYITADTERHPKDRERAQMIYNKIMLARYTDEQDKTEEFIKGIKALHIIEADRKDEPTISKMEQVEYCDYCKIRNKYWYEHCDTCDHKPKDEPQTERSEE